MSLSFHDKLRLLTIMESELDKCTMVGDGNAIKDYILEFRASTSLGFIVATTSDVGDGKCQYTKKLSCGLSIGFTDCSTVTVFLVCKTPDCFLELTRSLL